MYCEAAGLCTHSGCLFPLRVSLGSQHSYVILVMAGQSCMSHPGVAQMLHSQSCKSHAEDSPRGPLHLCCALSDQPVPVTFKHANSPLPDKHVRI